MSTEEAEKCLLNVLMKDFRGRNVTVTLIRRVWRMDKK